MTEVEVVPHDYEGRITVVMAPVAHPSQREVMTYTGSSLTYRHYGVLLAGDNGEETFFPYRQIRRIECQPVNP